MSRHGRVRVRRDPVRVILLRTLLGLAATAALMLSTGGTAMAHSGDRGAVADAAASTPSISVRSSRYGRVLFDGKGRALYLFTRERSSTPRCYGACATAWPPVLVSGRPRAGVGARSSLIGTTRRRGGARQATYRGQPLYYYVTDRRPGQITCQDVVEFGGTWLILAPDGRAVR